MTPDLLSATVSMIFMAVLCAALLFHLSRIAGPNRLLHGINATTVAGLIYLFGGAAFGWRLVPREVWFALYLALFAAVAGVTAMRRLQQGEAGFPSLSTLIQQGAMAYIWAPPTFWKPQLAFLLLLYFLFEIVASLRGRRPTSKVAEGNNRRPPLFPPKRVRGLSEFALATAAAAMAYVFAVGPGASPVTAPPPADQAGQTTTEQPAESTAVEESGPASPETAGKEPEPAADQTSPAQTVDAANAPDAGAPAVETARPSAPAAPAPSYTVAAGDTFKTIARRLYGSKEKWRAIANVNPGTKGSRLRAGQVIRLPAPPTR